MMTRSSPTAAGAKSRERSLPADNSAMWIPSKLSSVRLCTTKGLPRNTTIRPSLRALASGRSSVTGKPRSSSTRSIMAPTAPVAPTTATLNIAPACRFRLEIEGVVQRTNRPFNVAAVDHHGDPDGRGVDHEDVDVLVGQDPEHLCGDPRVGLHAGSDEGHLANLVVGGDGGVLERSLDRVEHIARTTELIEWQRERQVGATIGSHVLDDGVDVDQ